MPLHSGVLMCLLYTIKFCLHSDELLHWKTRPVLQIDKSRLRAGTCIYTQKHVIAWRTCS